MGSFFFPPFLFFSSSSSFPVSSSSSSSLLKERQMPGGRPFLYTNKNKGKEKVSCFSEERSHRCVRGMGRATGQGEGSGEEKKRNEVLERHGGRDRFAGTRKKSSSWSLLVTFVMVQRSTKISPSLPSSSSLPPYLASSIHKSELFSSSKASKTWSATAWRRRICSEKGRCCTRGAKSSKERIGC